MKSSSDTGRHFSRREFLFAGAGAGVGAALSGLVARNAMAQPSRDRRPAGPGEGGYGPLQPAGPELALPAGFTYRMFGVEGTIMSDGDPTPKGHDGMAAFELPNGNVRLIRNHEDRDNALTAAVKGNPDTAYDEKGPGGTTSLEVEPDGDRELARDFQSLNGTIVNCAGGPTPWNTWISCEETTAGETQGWTQDHGYNFEVPADADDEVEADPLRAMGRFVHEAVAVDPNTGFVYQTEDRGTAGFYRFIPDERGDMASGRLQMLAVRGRPNYNTTSGQQVGRPLPVEWVDIEDPDPPEAETNSLAVFQQGFADGGALFSRLEGCWRGDGSIFFHATDGGDAELGQVWEYRPRGRSGGQLILIFESESPEMLDAPDNITVSPRGGIVICEDGDGEQFLRGLTPEGNIFDFALNIKNDREFAGACFSPDGETLFVNIQGDTREPGPGNLGMTFAIWGPWEDGAL
ncbi:MAG: alkaline phosphatase PhoX [Rubrobacteraceae bacterium]